MNTEDPICSRPNFSAAHLLQKTFQGSICRQKMPRAQFAQNLLPGQWKHQCCVKPPREAKSLQRKATQCLKREDLFMFEAKILLYSNSPPQKPLYLLFWFFPQSSLPNYLGLGAIVKLNVTAPEPWKILAISNYHQINSTHPNQTNHLDFRLLDNPGLYRYE